MENRNIGSAAAGRCERKFLGQGGKYSVTSDLHTALSVERAEDMHQLLLVQMPGFKGMDLVTSGIVLGQNRDCTLGAQKRRECKRLRQRKKHRVAADIIQG